MELVKKTITYTPENEINQLMTIIIGQAQKGYSSFRNVDGKYFNGEIVKEDLGKGADLKSKSIKVNTLVTDVNPYTNSTIISFYFNDVLIHEENLFIAEAEVEEGSVFYKTTIKFN